MDHLRAWDACSAVRHWCGVGHCDHAPSRRAEAGSRWIPWKGDARWDCVVVVDVDVAAGGGGIAAAEIDIGVAVG